MIENPAPHQGSDARGIVAALLVRARAAQARYDGWSQQQVDAVCLAAGWAVLEPQRNRELSEIAVRDTGIGNVEDKVSKNFRKTLGLLRDLQGVRSVGVIASDAARGIVEIARPVGVVAAVTPSTSPVATPANKIINALKGRNAIVLAPSPKGWAVAHRLIEYVHAEMQRLGAPTNLVQLLPPPVSKEVTAELMRQVDLVIATGSRNNVHRAYGSGTPALGVGVGNVSSIIDSSASMADAARHIITSKTFDNATSCSCENSIVLLEPIAEAMLAELHNVGAVRLNAHEKQRLQSVVFNGSSLTGRATGRSAPDIARCSALERPEVLNARCLMVEESGIGPEYPFSGEKLCPVLTVYRAPDFANAVSLVRRIYAYQGAGHSVGVHTANEDHILELGLSLPVCRVIANQAHCIATGGSFDNGLPFSLSMACGTWGGNTTSDNIGWRRYVNIARVSRPIKPDSPNIESILRPYFDLVRR